MFSRSGTLGAAGMLRKKRTVHRTAHLGPPPQPVRFVISKQCRLLYNHILIKSNDFPPTVDIDIDSVMRLLFSTTDHMNTNISDERGYIYYTISTPFAFKKVTTITKYRWSGQIGIPETMGVIEWHRLRETVFRFNGEEVPANVMLQKKAWNTGRYFVGPDQQTYKWKLESSHCWMKRSDSHVELVRYHKKNLGILKEAHPAYLNISPSVAPMLDHVILTFVYMEWLRKEQEGSRRHTALSGAHSAQSQAVFASTASRCSGL